jgi:class 3 adenylate cyclase/tetratricopeptide (TPR) repeat protein
MRTCPTCGFENADTAKFCSECGTAFTSARPAREERKVVTVVFADLVGSTARAEGSDPEDVRALLRPYHERARRELEAFGGTVEKFIGDAVVAVFGAPVAHEDDPERAVRAALAVREAITKLNEEEPGRDLHVRIAVNTGEALVSLGASPEVGEGMVAGDVMNTAARLQSAASVDGILVGGQTYRATERQIVYREHEPIVAKGKTEPVRTWEALEPRSRLGVDLGGQGRAPLVGRDGELALLVAALKRARRERSTQLVTVVGVPGIGKSRLLYELGRVADEDDELITWKQGRSLPYGEGVSFWAFGEIVKAQAGILESDHADDAASKLRDVVSAVVSDAGEAAWVERHLRPLVGLGGDDAAGDLRGEAFAAWRRFIEAIAYCGPTVLLFEDLHWADDGLLDFVDGVVDWIYGVPLLIVCTARPELLERRPGWGGGKRNSTTLSLAPLDETDTARLVAALLKRPLLDVDTQQTLVARVAGNPLYAEEFVRMLAAGGGVEELLPETVQGIVAARIDLLPAEEKQVLQHAAVLGKVFWSDALATLSAVDRWRLTELLRSLERKEFIRREHRTVVAGEPQHAFVHALVRDAAYNQLPRQDRAQRHLSAAAWIESLPADRSEDRAEMLAHHYLAALALLGAAGADTTGVASSALRALHEAAERALSLHAYAQAARYVREALDLLPEDQEPSPEFLFAAGRALGASERRGLEELDRAVAGFEAAGEHERAAEAAIWTARHVWWADHLASIPWLERASNLLEGRGASRAKALVLAERSRIEMLEGRHEDANRLANEAIALAVELGDHEIEADALVTRGTVGAMLGEPSAMEQLERAAELVGGQGPVASRAYGNLSVAADTFGDARLSREFMEKSLQIEERLGDERAAMFMRDGLAWTLWETGAWDEALALVDELRAAPNQAEWILASAQSIWSNIRAGREPGYTLVDAVRVEVERVRGTSYSETVEIWVAYLAMVAARAGHAEEALAAINEVVDASDPPRRYVAVYVTISLALALLGREAEVNPLVATLSPSPLRDVCEALAARDFARAADVLEEAGYVTRAAEVRMDAARALAAKGRLAEAEEQLKLARAFYTRVQATAYLREAAEILAAAS